MFKGCDLWHANAHWLPPNLFHPHAPRGILIHDGSEVGGPILIDEIGSYKQEISRLRAEVERLESVLSERDDYQEWADRLADAIAVHFREDIGEHSNLNNPWANALELIDGTICR